MKLREGSGVPEYHSSVFHPTNTVVKCVLFVGSLVQIRNCSLPVLGLPYFYTWERLAVHTDRIIYNRHCIQILHRPYITERPGHMGDVLVKCVCMGGRSEISLRSGVLWIRIVAIDGLVKMFNVQYCTIQGSLSAEKRMSVFSE